MVFLAIILFIGLYIYIYGLKAFQSSLKKMHSDWFALIVRSHFVCFVSSLLGMLTCVTRALYFSAISGQSNWAVIKADFASGVSAVRKLLNAC